MVAFERLATKWQQKSDSQYPMDNTDNQNNTCQIAHTKLFKLKGQ